jgi:methyl-accepting chemotaxis protein
LTWTIGRRITVGFLAMIALLLALAALAVWALRSAGDGYNDALRTYQSEYAAALQAQGDMRAANVFYLRYLLETNETWNAGFDEEVTRSRARFMALMEGERRADRRALWAEAVALTDRWQQGARTSMEAARAGDGAEAARVRAEVVQPTRGQLEQVVARGLEEVGTGTEAAVEAAGLLAERSQVALVIGTIIAILLGLFAAHLLDRSVRGPLEETTNVLASSATQIMAATTEQATGAQQSLAAVTQTAATADEVSQTAEQAAERARTVAGSAQRAAEIGRQGRQAVEETGIAMAQVREQVDSIAESIRSLAEQAQAIGEINATVNDLSEQTNLLALNAAIEAARAGEQGRGFAVVASEIKSLADQSKSATARVRQLLSEVQGATGAAVDAAEEGSRRVAQGERQVGQAGETIRSLAEAVGGAAQAAAQIAASAGQQSTGMTQIRQAIGNIQQAAQQNLAATKQAEAASRDLSELGGRLLALIGGSGTARPRN